MFVIYMHCIHIYFITHGFITNRENDQLPVDRLAHLAQNCAGIWQRSWVRIRLKSEFFHPMPYNKSFIDQTSSVIMVGYWPRSLFAFLWTSTSSRSIKTPISSHVDLALGQQRIYIHI